MVRNLTAAVLGLAALAAGPMASAARAETPRQAWLAGHPVADARYQAWRENHPFRSGWDFVGPAAPVVVDPVRVGPVVGALIAVPAVAPAPAQGAAAAGYQDFVVGPFEFEARARDEAEGLRGRGFRAEVYFVPGRGWMVKAWRRE